MYRNQCFPTIKLGIISTFLLVGICTKRDWNTDMVPDTESDFFLQYTNVKIKFYSK